MYLIISVYFSTEFIRSKYRGLSIVTKYLIDKGFKNSAQIIESKIERIKNLTKMQV